MKTFKQIAPLWAKSIENESIVSDGLDMMDFECCIVGEAYGFDDEYKNEYGCGTCEQFANAFALKIVQGIEGDLELYDSYTTLIKQFEEHWNEKHEN